MEDGSWPIGFCVKEVDPTQNWDTMALQNLKTVKFFIPCCGEGPHEHEGVEQILIESSSQMSSNYT